MVSQGTELQATSSSPGRWMGLDVGAKRIGVAVSDPLRLTARPLTTLARTADEAEFEQLRELLDQWQIERLVVGYPRRLTGETSASTQLVDRFLARLRTVTSVPFERTEERLSSKAAEQRMAAMRIPVRERRRRRDAFAAALILEWYLGENRGS